MLETVDMWNARSSQPRSLKGKRCRLKKKKGRKAITGFDRGPTCRQRGRRSSWDSWCTKATTSCTQAGSTVQRCLGLRSFSCGEKLTWWRCSVEANKQPIAGEYGSALLHQFFSHSLRVRFCQLWNILKWTGSVKWSNRQQGKNK